MDGHFAHDAVIGYACVYATCTLSASATVQVAYTQAHPLNSNTISTSFEITIIIYFLFLRSRHTKYAEYRKIRI